jgi:hypothetical protein
MSRSTSQMALATLNEVGRAGARPTSHVHLGNPVTGGCSRNGHVPDSCPAKECS